MSWKLTKKKESSRSPAQGLNSNLQDSFSLFKAGLLQVQVLEAKGLSLPPGITVPPAVKNAMGTSSFITASFGGASARNPNRDSMQRKQCWWLPYCVLEFDKNEVMIDALSGDMGNPRWCYSANFDSTRESEASLQIYLRTAQTGSNHNDMGNDIFLGGVKISPTFKAAANIDEWVPITNGTGSIHMRIFYHPHEKNKALTIADFDLLKVIGKGSFGKVMQVRKKDTSRIYALKTIRKAHIVSRSEVNHTLAERTVLAQVNNPFIVPLKFSFQSPEKLYLVLAFVNGGELFHHLQREGRFDEDRSRFYASELLCALECLHEFNVVYRDLKPENILLDYTGHIALCDFGLCKLNMTKSETTNTFCGTPEYLAPELLHGQGYTKTVDWWTLGVLLYEMLTGLPPFYDENTNEMYRKILQDELHFPEEVKKDARDLLRGLLTRDPNHRLGNNGAQDIKSHIFFHAIDWKKLMQKKVQPPFKPSVESAIDTSNFDEEFTSEVPLDSVVDDSHLSETVQRQFDGFTWNPTGELMSESVGGSVIG